MSDGMFLMVFGGVLVSSASVLALIRSAIFKKKPPRQVSISKARESSEAENRE